MSEYTQEETILHFVKQQPDRIWFAKDFQNGEKFVGYEAGPRICGLVEKGYMEKVGTFDEHGNPGGKYAGYKLLTNPVIAKREPKKTKKQLIKDAFIAGFRATPTLFMTVEQLADEYINNL